MNKITSIVRPTVKFAKVVTSEMKHLTQTVKISCDKYEMDKRLNMYFKTKTEEYAFKENVDCDEGDYVLIREIEEVPLDGLKIRYQVEKRIYQNGYLIDPVSGKRSALTEYLDDIQKTCELFGYKRSYFKSDS